MPAFRSPYLVLGLVLLLAAVMVGGSFALTEPRPMPTAPAVGGASPGSSAVPGDGSTPTPGKTDEPLPPGVTPAPGSTPPPVAKDVTPVSVEPEDLEGYEWPLRNALITSRMAPREAGFVIIDGQEVHDGLDLATHCGDEVRAAHDGTVLYEGRNFDPYIGYWGDPTPIYARLERLGRTNDQPIVVVVDDGNGYRSMYVHLNETTVDAGMTVQAGDIIGREGMTGFATGCHLHYTLIRMDGAWLEVLPRLARFGYPPYVRERIDPLDVLDWGDEYAPQRLRDRVNGSPSPDAATPSPEPVQSPSTTPDSTPVTESPSPIPLPS